MGKRVLVTGAGSGFGKAASIALAQRGHQVIATTQTDAQAERLTYEKPHLQVERLDITTNDIAKVDHWGIDVLINNAGIGRSGPMAEIPLEQARQVLEVNVLGSLAITQRVLRQMIPRGAGRILIMSSVGGLVTVPTFGAYTMSKHALEAFGKTLSAELSATGVDVALIHPGPYATGFNDRMADSMWDWFDGEALQRGDTEAFKAVGEGIKSNQMDPAEVVQLIVELVAADDVALQNLVPPDVLAAFGQ
ncbi:MAG: SDR family NAD(P)-dependent oxidoreductase [Pseudomonadota bacterium]